MLRDNLPKSMPRCSRTVSSVLVTFGLAVMNLGCGNGPQAVFKYRPTTDDLISEANKAVIKTLTEDFGTPETLVAWERFPINYGGVKGTVTSTEGSSGSVAVTLEGDSSKISRNAPLLWVSGSQAGGKSAETSVKGFSAELKTLQLASGAGTASTGDRFVVGFGEDMQLGRVVYMKNCMHCHGVTGDGNGPTGKFLNPRPRDYRNGKFKFTSTQSQEKATRDDLHRVVKYGIPGTYMPSFLLLGERETTAVVEYVRWLAIRGEFEKRFVEELTNDYSQTAIKDATDKAEKSYLEKKKNKEEAEKPMNLSKAIKSAGTAFKKYVDDKEFDGAIEETANLLAAAWTQAETPDVLVVPTTQRVEDTPESRERGRLLYMSNTTKCYTCHGPTGRGDGAATEDFWDKPGTSVKYPNRGLHDEWGNPLKPRNLTSGQYRGGRRPLDLFRRIRAGIKGTPMPAFGDTVLKEPQVWDIVNYVMSLPYQPKQPTAVKHPAEVVANNEEKPAN
ncbi:MAG: cytochrome c [Schlesneria sp.]